MRILVVGGYGLIGGYVVARLVTDGHDVRAVGRDVARAGRRFPAVQWSRVDIGHMTGAAWAPHLDGVDGVVNCAGSLQDGPGDDLAAVHVRGLVNLAEAAKRAGVLRFVHISAAGMAEDAGSRFQRTKCEGEAALRAIAIDWVILRPGLVLAPAAFGGGALLRGLAAFPLVIPAVHAASQVQVAGVHDIAQAVVTALRPDAPAKVAVDLVAQPMTTLADVLLALRGWLGLPPAPILALPPALARLTARCSDALAWLGWRSPMRTTAILQLRHGVRGDPEPALRLLGLRLRALEAILAAEPSGVQERWFAKLYFVKPLALAVLSAFWMVSGVIGLLHIQSAADLLAGAGFSLPAAKAAVLVGSFVDLGLGLLVAFRRAVPWALAGMMATSLAYLVGATIWRQDLWADPLGPMLKVLPEMALVCAAAAMLDTR